MTTRRKVRSDKGKPRKAKVPRPVRRLYVVLWGTNARYVPATSDEQAVQRWRESPSAARFVGMHLVTGEVRVRLGTNDEVTEWNESHVGSLPYPEAI